MNPYIENYVKKQVAPIIVRSVENLMKNGNVSLQEACRLLGRPLEEYEEAKKLVTKNDKTKGEDHNA